MSDISTIDVSVILPCYNEAKILRSSVSTVQAVMNQTRYRYEIIIAEDASRDGTDTIAKMLSEEFPNVIWIHREERRGRGSAVANAIMQSRGDICGYLDTDFETPAHYIPAFVSAIENGADIASADRVYRMNFWERCVRAHKVLAHAVYAMLSRVALRVPLRDIESGFKFFRRARILPILAQIKDMHWFWDTEVMVRPYYAGYAVKEIPVVFTPDPTHESKVDLMKDSVDHLRQLLAFRREIRQTYWRGVKPPVKL